MGGVHATAWPCLRYPWDAGRRNAVLYLRFSPAWFCPSSSLQLRRRVPSAAPATGPGRLRHRPRAKAASAAKSRPLPAADGASRLGSKQAVTSPPTAAVRLNSGATPTPRRAAERPARLGGDRWQRAGGSARGKWTGTRQQGTRTTPRKGREEKSHGARSHALSLGEATPP